MTTTAFTTREQNIQTVRRLYDAYFAGDLPAALAEVTADVDWAAEAASTSVPWYGQRRGHDGVAAFFGAIAGNVDIDRFGIVSTLANDTEVATIVRWSYTVRATGRSATMLMQHWWRLTDGKIGYFRGSEDSEQSAAAFGH